MTALIITVLGDDQPGLVDALARAVASHDGNWVESSLSRLSGKFAGVVRITAPDDQANALADAIRNLGETDGLRIVVEPVADDTPSPQQPGPDLVLEAIGLDRTGIVRDIAHALARHGVNVTAFESRVFNAPMSGERMFRAEARLTAPEALDAGSLNSALDAVAEALNVEIQLHDQQA
ncbi:MAG: glycine cleavage system protein R [Phycisphaeraceae bacterium]